MQVNNSIKLLQLSLNKELLKNGDIIEGEILEVLDDLVVIDFKELGTIRAGTENDLRDYKDESLKFMVKSFTGDKIELKPIFEDLETTASFKTDGLADFESKTEDYIANILETFNIRKNPESMKLVDSLIEYNVKIDVTTLLDGVKVLDKLEQMNNLKEDDVVLLPKSLEGEAELWKTSNLDSEIELGNEDLKKIIIKEGQRDTGNLDLKAEPNIESRESKTQAINRDSFNIIKNDEIKSTIKKLRSSLGEYSIEDLKSDTIKTIAFFTKFDIKPSLNNMKYFLQIKEEPELFSEDFKILENIMEEEFTNHIKRFSINREASINSSENEVLNYKEVLEELEREIERRFPELSKELKETIKELHNKSGFLDEMNKELTFAYLPMNFKPELKSAMTLVKEKKKKNRANSKVNVFINLNTNSLGNVKIMCEALNNDILVKFNNLKSEDLDLFQKNEGNLKALVESTGYRIKSVKYSSKKNEDNILNSLVVNKNPIYYLDVQV